MTSATLTIRDTIARDLTKEIPGAGVVKVAETALLATDLREYVLTTQLAAEYAKVLERVVDAARPATTPSDRVGIWVSGFFGSGKSHFAKLLGHILADTPTPEGGSRELFRQHLQSGRPKDDRVAELLQEAQTYKLKAHLVAFDISAKAASSGHVGLTLLRAFYESLGLSSVISFATVEAELQKLGRYDAFVELYRQTNGTGWADDRDLVSSDIAMATSLAKLWPERYPSMETAQQSLGLALDEFDRLSIDGVVTRLSEWVASRSTSKEPLDLVFVVDEVGAWAGRRLERIEQIRSLIETFASRGGGRLWLIATSQERLSDVVSNSTELDSPRDAEQLLQRLEARFPVNVHLESGEVGTVIETRILRKRAPARPALEALWESESGTLRDIAEPPGLELNGQYPAADKDRFIADYPFLPYQLPAAADIFGNMRGVKVSSGQRSMLKVALDATAAIADRPVGAVVAWDQIFDSANRGNEFADEAYLSSQGLEFIAKADRDLEGTTPLDRPSRLLKVLWLVQQAQRIPRTVRNLARLLVTALDVNVLQLERDVEATLEALAKLSYVRKDPASQEWKFLTPDEVTIERLISRIATEVGETDVRRERQQMFAERLKALLPGRLTMGATNTTFEYGVFLNDAPIANDSAAVGLRAYFASASQAQKVAEDYAAYLSAPEVYWTITVPARLEERLRRAMAIERLQGDPEFGQIATQRTREEARKLESEAAQLRADAGQAVDGALRDGTVYAGGGQDHLGAGSGQAKTRIEEAIRDRLAIVFDRFPDGDRTFNPSNVERLLAVAPGDRRSLDPSIGLFDETGHVHDHHPVAEELLTYLRSSTRTEGQDVAAHFRSKPFGWPADLIRYAAAALFADGRLSLVDRSGRRYDNPKESAARAQLGTGGFKTIRLDVEESPLMVEEIAAARKLLQDLGHQAPDAAVATILDSAARFRQQAAGRLTYVTQATQAGFPLPAAYSVIGTLLDEVGGTGTPATRVRSMLLRSDDLMAADAALKRLELFSKDHGFDQYARSQRLLAAALDGGLLDDPTWGPVVTQARDEMQAMVDQRRVLDEWNAAFSVERAQLITGFKSIYLPLRADVSDRTMAARDAVLKSPEYDALKVEHRVKVLGAFMADGRPLAEIKAAELKGDDDLIRANEVYSIAHLRTKLASLPSVLADAQRMVLQLLAEQQEEEGRPSVYAWNPQAAFAGTTFSTEAEVDAAFGTVAEKLKALVRDGKTVKVL